MAILFWLVLLSAGGLIAINGSAAARSFLGLILLATVSTALTDLSESQDAAAIYLAIDVTLLIVSLICVVRLDAYWPIWFAGFQTITVASEFARIVLSGPIPSMYANVAGFWALPALMTMTAGVMLDRRARQNSGRRALRQPGH